MIIYNCVTADNCALIVQLYYTRQPSFSILGHFEPCEIYNRRLRNILTYLLPYLHLACFVSNVTFFVLLVFAIYGNLSLPFSLPLPSPYFPILPIPL